MSHITPATRVGHQHPSHVPVAAPPPRTSTQQSTQERAQIAAIYAEAQTEHWSAAKTNSAVNKIIAQSPADSTSSSNDQSSPLDQTNLIDESA